MTESGKLDQFEGIFRNKKILVTGDTGFKGSWMSIWLRELGAQVYGYALPPLTERDNFVTTGLSEKINHRDGDVRDQKALSDYFLEVKPDMAFHLAAQPLVLDSYKDPHYNFETNLMGTVNFFEAVRHCPSVKVAVNVTTDKCYQNNEWVWGYRETDPMGGHDPYSASKGCSELITQSYIKSFFSAGKTCHVASARAGNVIGGGDWAADRIIPDIMRALESGAEAEIRNPASVRPWQFVLEPVSGYLKLAQMLFTGGKSFSGPWNFGPSSYYNYSVSDVVKEIGRIVPQLKFNFPENNAALHEAVLLRLDISKAVNYLGWQPRLSFEETISFTVNGYLDEKNAADLYRSRVEQVTAFCQSTLP